MPLSAGMLVKKCSKASNPPAEAPMPTTWKVSFITVLPGDTAGDNDCLSLWGVLERAGFFRMGMGYGSLMRSHDETGIPFFPGMAVRPWKPIRFRQPFIDSIPTMGWDAT